MDPKDIFELIIKADEKQKYATGANADLRRDQARHCSSRREMRRVRSATRGWCGKRRPGSPTSTWTERSA